MGPALPPQTKSVVRAMDAIEQYLDREHHHKLKGFVTTGASKRGWTTWFTGTVDDRVIGMIPIVYDNLNMAAQMDQQREVYGAYSEQIDDYTEYGLQDRLQSPEGAVLGSIVDPYTYRQHVTEPVLILAGANDPYWTLESAQLYFDDIPGPTSILYALTADMTWWHRRDPRPPQARHGRLPAPPGIRAMAGAGLGSPLTAGRASVTLKSDIGPRVGASGGHVGHHGLPPLDLALLRLRGRWNAYQAQRRRARASLPWRRDDEGRRVDPHRDRAGSGCPLHGSHRGDAVAVAGSDPHSHDRCRYREAAVAPLSEPRRRSDGAAPLHSSLKEPKMPYMTVVLALTTAFARVGVTDTDAGYVLACGDYSVEVERDDGHLRFSGPSRDTIGEAALWSVGLADGAEVSSSAASVEWSRAGDALVAETSAAGLTVLTRRSTPGHQSVDVLRGSSGSTSAVAVLCDSATRPCAG